MSESVGAIYMWSIAEAAGTDEVTQREGVREDGRKTGLLILEEPHHL